MTGLPESGPASRSAFRSIWNELDGVGRSARGGGYTRFAWTSVELDLRAWFEAEARRRDLDVTEDRNGNLWAWWGAPGPEAVVTGSHLDSVPSGGAYDGPLGVASAFLAVDELKRRGVVPRRPFAVTAFVEEEGGRFGIACLGSRLLTGAYDADKARSLRDADGVTLAEALTRAGRAPEHLGRDEETLGHIGCFVELHVEQGRGLVDLGEPVGVASEIWPHGRYRLDFTGMPNHAGTTRMEDRRDPMQTFAATALAASAEALRAGQRATFGRLHVVPNGTNAIPSLVTAWLDARCHDDETLERLVAEVVRAAEQRALADGTAVQVTAESVTRAVRFHEDLSARIAVAGAAAGRPVLPTQAGHDAGILADTGIPSAMLFVRNPTGVSHSPEEFAEDDDCATGVLALADVLADLLTGEPQR